MNRVIVPETIGAPVSSFAHAIEIPPGARQVWVSGQIGSDMQGQLPEDLEAQVRNTFVNVREVLRAADMDLSDIVRLNSYLTDQNYVGTFRKVREEIMGDILTASTLVVVAGLVHPLMKVEIECVAARA